MKNWITTGIAAMMFCLIATATTAQSDDKVFMAVEQPPEYIDNGMPGLITFIGNNLSYPATARKNNVQGNVYISFIVEKDGSISQAEVKKGVDKSLDDEALRVVKLTRWKPGQQNGKVVRSHMVLPISYKI